MEQPAHDNVRGKQLVKIWEGGTGGVENYAWVELLHLSDEFATVVRKEGETVSLEAVDTRYIVDVLDAN